MRAKETEKRGDFLLAEVRNRGESICSGRRAYTAGRYSFPAYFPARLVTLEIDGERVLPGTGAEVVEDPSAWMRQDFTRPLRLNAGLRSIRMLILYCVMRWTRYRRLIGYESPQSHH